MGYEGVYFSWACFPGAIVSFPGMDCSNEKENSVYYYCRQTVELTCLDVLTGSTPTPDGVCTEGCYCPEGLVTDGNRCVTEEECGCVYEGEYYSVGTIVTISHDKLDVRIY